MPTIGSSNKKYYSGRNVSLKSVKSLGKLGLITPNTLLPTMPKIATDLQNPISAPPRIQPYQTGDLKNVRF